MMQDNSPYTQILKALNKDSEFYPYVYVGIVVSPSPIQIQVGDVLLTQEDIVFPEHFVVGRKAKVRIEESLESEKWGNTTRLEMQTKNWSISDVEKELKGGEEFFMLPIKNMRKFMILARMAKAH